MDALLRDKRVFKSKVTRLEKQTVAWQDGTDKNTELLSIYLSSAHELTVECDSLFRSIGQQCEEKHYEVYVLYTYAGESNYRGHTNYNTYVHMRN
jgi:hypothetical protein